MATGDGRAVSAKLSQNYSTYFRLTTSTGIARLVVMGGGWHATKASRVLAALVRIGWRVVRQSGSHRTLGREGWSNYVFAFHDRDEIGPVMLARIGRATGLKPGDL